MILVSHIAHRKGHHDSIVTHCTPHNHPPYRVMAFRGLIWEKYYFALLRVHRYEIKFCCSTEVAWGLFPQDTCYEVNN